MDECQFFGISKSVDVATDAVREMSCVAAVEVSQKRMNIISPADCSNAYESISAISDNSSDRGMRILLYYILVNLLRTCLSFVDARRNLSDVGAKIGGNVGIFYSVRHFRHWFRRPQRNTSASEIRSIECGREVLEIIFFRDTGAFIMRYGGAVKGTIASAILRLSFLLPALTGELHM